jgi:hypothetical protein
MTLGSKKDYRTSSFRVCVARMTSTGDDLGRGLPSFLPPTRSGHTVATQQMGEKTTAMLVLHSAEVVHTPHES